MGVCTQFCEAAALGEKACTQTSEAATPCIGRKRAHKPVKLLLLALGKSVHTNKWSRYSLHWEKACTQTSEPLIPCFGKKRAHEPVKPLLLALGESVHTNQWIRYSLHWEKRCTQTSEAATLRLHSLYTKQIWASHCVRYKYIDGI